MCKCAESTVYYWQDRLNNGFHYWQRLPALMGKLCAKSFKRLSSNLVHTNHYIVIRWGQWRQFSPRERERDQSENPSLPSHFLVPHLIITPFHSASPLLLASNPYVMWRKFSCPRNVVSLFTSTRFILEFCIFRIHFIALQMISDDLIFLDLVKNTIYKKNRQYYNQMQI